MEATVQGLARILLNAVPTFLIVLFLILYLQRVFYRPLAQMLKKRYDDTEGARLAAEESLKRAEQRTAEYEERLRRARQEIYADQDRYFRALEQQHGEAIEKARREAQGQVEQATDQLNAEAARAQVSLESRSAELADLIAARILGRSAA